MVIQFYEHNSSKLYTLKELNLRLMNVSSIKLFNEIFKKSVQIAWGPEVGLSSPALLTHPDLPNAGGSWSLSFYICQLFGLVSRMGALSGFKEVILYSC